MRKWNKILMTGMVIPGIFVQSFTASASQKDMEITATVEENQGLPSYSVVIPESVSMGSLSRVTENVKEYEIIVKTEEKKGVITVEAPEEGCLLKEEDALKFTNDFGKQAFQAKGSETEKHLTGKIYIAPEEVQKVPVGRYRGTTIFTIGYTENEDSEPTPTPKPTPTPEPTPNPTPTPEPTPTPNPTPTPSPDQGLDRSNLADGVYSITGNMVKIDKATASMADKAISHTIKLTVKNGNYEITLDFTGLDIGGQYGYMGKLSYYEDGYTQNSYGVIQGTLKSTTIDAYQTAADGTKLADAYGTDYPKKVTLPLIRQAVKDGFVPLQVEVPIMNLIAGAGTQQMFLALDWSTLKTANEEDPAFDDHDQSSGSTSSGNTNLGGSSLGNNTLGSSLGNNKLNGSSLGKNTLGSNTLGKNTLGTALKTGDTNEIYLWAALAVGAAAAAVISREYKKHEK